MRVLVSSFALAALVFVGGCAGPSSAMKKPAPAPVAVAVDATASPTPGGLKVGGVVFDGSTTPTQSVPAFAAAKRELPTIASYWYGGGGTRPADFPETRDALLGEASCALVPVYGYVGSPASATTLFSVIQPLKRSYLLVLVRNNAIIGTCDWTDLGGTGAWQSVHAYPDAFNLAGATTALAGGLGTESFMVRVLAVPRGYWVIGVAPGKEFARFLGQDGSFADDPSSTRLYTPSEVFRYGAPHGDGS